MVKHDLILVKLIIISLRFLCSLFDSCSFILRTELGHQEGGWGWGGGEREGKRCDGEGCPGFPRIVLTWVFPSLLSGSHNFH